MQPSSTGSKEYFVPVPAFMIDGGKLKEEITEVQIHDCIGKTLDLFSGFEQMDKRDMGIFPTLPQGPVDVIYHEARIVGSQLCFVVTFSSIPPLAVRNASVVVTMPPEWFDAGGNLTREITGGLVESLLTVKGSAGLSVPEEKRIKTLKVKRWEIAGRDLTIHYEDPK